MADFSYDLDLNTKGFKKNLNKILADLDNVMQDLVRINKIQAFDDKEIKTYNKHTDDLQEDLDEIQEDLKGIKSTDAFDDKSVDKYGKSVDEVGKKSKSSSGALGGLGKKVKGIGFTALAGGATAAVAGIGLLAVKSTELEQAFSEIQAQTGATNEEMEAMRESSSKLFSEGVGEDVVDVGKKIGLVKQQLGSMLDPDEVNEFTKSVEGIAKTFDKDFNEVVSNSRGLIKNWGLTGEESADLVAYGLQNAGNAQDDFLDTLNEYSVLAKNAGFAAEEFTGTLTKGIQEGVHNTDKLADAIKETQIRLMEGDITRELLDAQEIFGKQLPANLNKTIQGIVKAGEQGKKSTQEVMQESAQAIGKAFDEGKISKTVRDKMERAFAGTPAEDIGGGMYSRIFSADIPTEEIKQKATEASNKIDEALKPKGLEGIKRAFSVIISDLATDLYPVLEPIIKNITGIIQSISPLLEETFPKIAEIIGKVFDDVMPLIESVIEAFTPLLNIILDILEPIYGMLDPIIDMLSPIIKMVGRVLQPILRQISGIINKLAPIITDLLESIVPLIIEVADLMGDLIVIWFDMQEAIMDAVAEIFGFESGLDMLTATLGLVADAVTGVIDVITTLVSWVGDAVEAVGGFFGLVEEETEREFGKYSQAADNSMEMVTKNSLKYHQDMAEGVIGGYNMMGEAQNDFSLIVKDSSEDEQDNLDKTNKKRGDYNKKVKETISLLEKLNKNQKSLDSLYDSSVEKMIELTLAGKDGTEEYIKLEEATKNLKEQLDGVGNEIEQIEDMKFEIKMAFDIQGEDFSAILDDMDIAKPGIVIEPQPEIDDEKFKGDVKYLFGFMSEKGWVEGILPPLSFNLSEVMDLKGEEVEKELSDTQEAIKDFANTAVDSISNTTTKLLTGQENAAEAIINLTFDFLQTMVPIWSAQILGGSLATPQSIATAGGWGLAQWALLTGILQGVVEAARASITGFEEGGYTGEKGLSEVAGVVHGQEYVIPAPQTKKYRPLLEDIHRGDLDITNYAEYGNKDIGAKIDETNRRLERVEKAQLSSYERSAVEVKMGDLKARGSDLVSQMDKIKRRKMQT